MRPRSVLRGLQSSCVTVQAGMIEGRKLRTRQQPWADTVCVVGVGLSSGAAGLRVWVELARHWQSLR
eukprot:1924214-Rhodomonas_salina.11